MNKQVDTFQSSPSRFEQASIIAIIPALNEEHAIGAIVRELLAFGVTKVVVVNNGSTDATSLNASSAGALVLDEPKPGYGRACLRGLSAVTNEQIVLFVDGDGSDDLSALASLIDPLSNDRADFVIGSRSRGIREPGSMTVPQLFGNWLATRLICLLWGYRYSDLGPLRALRIEALKLLPLQDQTYGWTVEMQILAVANRLRILEVPVNYRKRIGRSKISGTIRGVFGAGTKIITTIAKLWICERVLLRPNTYASCSKGLQQKAKRRRGIGLPDRF